MVVETRLVFCSWVGCPRGLAAVSEKVRQLDLQLQYTNKKLFLAVLAH